MKDILTVIKFSMKDLATKKSFIISTLIIAVMLVIGTNIPNIIDAFTKDDDSDSKKTILIKDEENIFEGYLNNNIEINGYLLEITDLNEDKIKDEIKEEKASGALIITKGTETTLHYDYIVEDGTMVYYIPEEVETTLMNLYQTKEIIKLGITEEQLNGLYPTTDYDIVSIEEEAKGNILGYMAAAMVLFFAIFYTAYQVSVSITTEKTSKIIETIATSTSPTVIVIGKTIGTGMVGFLQILFLGIVGVTSAYLCMDKEIIEMVFDTSTLTVGLAIITLIYFLLGYFTYAFIYALTGSTVSKPEDVQASNQPVSLISIVGFYLAYFTMINPTSSLYKLASLLPISSPFCMPFRYMMGLASISDVILSIVILIATILVIAFISIRIYTNAILNYGSRLTIKDLVKMFKQK